MLGLPKRLGLNGENLLWYNELEERKRGGGLEKRGSDGGGCLTQEGGGGDWRDADACRDGSERQNPKIK